MFKETEIGEVTLKHSMDDVVFRFTNYSTMTGFVKQAFNANPNITIIINVKEKQAEVKSE